MSAAHRESQYRVVTNRAGRRGAHELYPIGLRDRLPRVEVPLLAPDPDVALDLPAVFEQANRHGAYHRRLDYAGPLPEPPLPPDEEAWLRARLAGRPLIG